MYAPSAMGMRCDSPSVVSFILFTSTPSTSRESSSSHSRPHTTLMTFHPEPRKTDSSSWMILPLPRAERLGLVALAVTDERPHALVARVADAAVLEVAIEARLVDRGDRAEAHRDRRELPELRHEAGVRIRGEALARNDLAPEVVELRFGQPPFEVGAGVDAGRGVSLEEDLVAAGRIVLALEEVVEADLIQRRRRRVRRQVAADALVVVIRAHDHRDGVPADELADAVLHLLVAGEIGLLLGGDRVDVPGLRERRQAHLQHARALEELVEDEPGALRAGLLDQCVKRLDPLLCFLGIDVRKLPLELVEDLVHPIKLYGR